MNNIKYKIFKFMSHLYLHELYKFLNIFLYCSILHLHMILMDPILQNVIIG